MSLLIAFCWLATACGGDASTRLCFGSSAFCESAFGRNRSPDADAGPDRDAVPGELVRLDGSGSFDPDGAIASFSWSQGAGPPVALRNATEAVATFVAPPADVRVRLSFRLVVTDDDRSSDEDEVAVTVVPTATAAVARGVALLKTVHRPRPEVVPGDCPQCWSRLALWLAARTAAAPADPEPDRLLDELRLLTLLNPAPPPTLTGARLALYRLAQRRVATFTRLRDPATAERATLLAADTAPDAADPWPATIAAAWPRLRWLAASAGQRENLARWLLHAPPRTTSTEAVAAAVLLLAEDVAGLPGER